MRIGIFSDRYLPLTDGICTSIEDFRRELESRGHEVYVFAPRPSWRYKAPSSRIIFFAAVKGLFFEDYRAGLFFPPQAIAQIEKLNLDIIHFQTPGPIGLLGAYYALRRKIPLVTTYHTDLYEYVKHYRNVLPGLLGISLFAPMIMGGNMEEYRTALSSIKPERNLDEWNQKVVLRTLTLLHNHCNLVIAPSKKIEKQLIEWKTKTKITTLPSGVDKITTSKREVTIIRKKFGFNLTDQVILFVGRIGTEKNLGVLIHSFDAIARSNEHAKLVIVGNGDDINQFKDQAAKSLFSERIIFTGWIDRHKLGAVYGASTVYAFPSLTETQGLTLNEAAWAGLPIVVMDPDVSEVVKNNQNGYISKNNPRDLASKILRILQDTKLREKMQNRSTELASEISVKHQTTKLLELYQDTVDQYQPVGND